MGIIELLTNGLLTVINGAWSTVTLVVHPVTLAVVALAVSFAWLALLESDELDRQSTKPEVPRGV